MDIKYKKEYERKKLAENLIKKWGATGLLKGLKPGSDLDKMTKLLESIPKQKIEH